MKFKELLFPKVLTPVHDEPSDVRAVNDEKTTANDLSLETPYWGYEPRDYYFSAEFSALSNGDSIDLWTQQLLNTFSDEMIASTLERRLSDIAKREMANIYAQRITHLNVLHTLGVRRSSLQEGYEAKMKELMAQRSLIDSEIDKIVRESKKCKWRNFNYD